MITNFHESYLKIHRANRHIEELNSCINEFLKTDFYRIGLKKDFDTGRNKIQITKEPLPEMVPLIIGDAVHNLRSALDYAACEIVRCAGINDADTHFPFDESGDRLKTKIEKGKIYRANPKSVRSFSTKYSLIRLGIFPCGLSTNSTGTTNTGC